MTRFDELLQRVHDCRICADHLEHGVRPVLQVHPRAKLLIAGQAPGRKVHESGIPFDDASGDRLRDWMGVDRETFYDRTKIAILPMGFCYPGSGKSGDQPPRSECAAEWRRPMLLALNAVELTLVIGQYAMAYHLKDAATTLTDTVRNWKQHGSHLLPLPHPSPRNNLWLRRNPWFEEELLPELRKRVASLCTRQR